MHDVIADLLDRPDMQHAVVTGRAAPQELIDVADTVTEMTVVKARLQGRHRGAAGHGMVARAVLIAAAASGQGKTTVTAALARKLVRAGLPRARIFKCGPDFIDPMVLARACGSPVEVA